jgi:ferrous iron transport protein B
MATRALPTRKERIITIALITLIPCSARTAIILGVAATYAGVQYALAIYLISLVLIIASGRLLRATVPGRTAGLVLEIPLIRRPALVPILKKTWLRMREFLYIAVPLLIVGSIVFGPASVASSRRRWRRSPSVFWAFLPSRPSVSSTGC